MSVPNTTYRVLVEKLGSQDPSQFVGNEGEVFYDPNNPELKLSDGTTAGGVSIGGTGGGGSGESYWVETGAGIHTTSNVGAGTTNPRFALEVGAVGSAGTSLWVNGDARITGILTVGTSSIVLDGNSDTITVPNLVVTETTSGVTADTGDVKFEDDEIYTETGRLSIYSIGAGEGNYNRVDIESDSITLDSNQDINLTCGTDLEIAVNNSVNSKTFTFTTEGSLQFPDTTKQTTAYTGISTGINSLVESELSVGSFRYRISNTGQPQVLSSDIERGLVWSTVDSSNTVITGGSSGGGLAIVGITTWVGLTTTTLTTWGDSSVAHIVEPSTASGYRVTFVLSVASGGSRGGIHVEKLF
jgi:hypothetical protein